MPPYPLAGLRVLEFARVVSGPIAGRMMCDLGADVVKVEPPDGDLTRRWGEVRHGVSGWFFQQNAGKRNMCIDLKASDGPELVRRLVTVTDVLIENYRPGVMHRFGLDYATLAALNPGLVMLSISGFGQNGPDADRQAYAPVVHAESGLIARQAEFDAAWPTDPVLSIADTNAGLHGLIAVLAALRLRDQTGRGQHIDLGMLDAMLATDDYASHGIDGYPIRRLGGEVWEAPGGPLLIAGEFRNTWFELSRVHRLADPSPKGADLETKIHSRRHAVRRWLLEFSDRPAVTAALEEANLAWAEVRSTESAFTSPSVAARGIVAEVDDDHGGRRRVVQSPYRFSEARSGVRGPAGTRGADNAAVLADWLELGGDEVDGLVARGVLLSEHSG